MDVVSVQFDSEERRVIIAEFSSVQDASFWRNLGVVSRDDGRYTQFQLKTGTATSASSTPALKRAFSLHLSTAP